MLVSIAYVGEYTYVLNSITCAGEHNIRVGEYNMCVGEYNMWWLV